MQKEFETVQGIKLGKLQTSDVYRIFWTSTSEKQC